MISSIDQEKCIGCGTCFKSCPLDVFRLSLQQTEISPCSNSCPSGNDMRSCNYLLQHGRPEEALQVLKKTMPIPAITGRVCFHPCEKDCSRGNLDEAVNANAIEQFLGDLDLSLKEEKSPVKHIKKIAVIGSGPAGLSAAWFLNQMGYSVTVFEKMPLPGGMLRYGIPAYRLPDEIIAKQIEKFQDAGIEFICSWKNGSEKGWLPKLREKYSAVIIATGASEGRLPGLAGENSSGIFTGLDFLRGIRSGECVHFDENSSVAVIGGGDVAIDTAISAQKLGAKNIFMVCLEAKDRMPAFPHNRKEAEAHHINIYDSTGVSSLRFNEEGKLIGIECVPCTNVFDENGKFNPQFDNSPSSRRILPCNTVIFSIGQRSDLSSLSDDLQLSRNRIVADSDTLETSLEGVFAAGDVVTGPSSVTGCVASGHKAAISAARFLSGSEMKRKTSSQTVADNMLTRVDKDKIEKLPRMERKSVLNVGFEEARIGLTLDEVMAESRRCLTCGAKAYIAYTDDCMTCYTCEVRCPADAIDVHPFKERLPRTLDTVCRNVKEENI